MTGFSLFFIVFQCGFGVSFRRTAETGRFYAGLPVLNSGGRQNQDIRLGKPMVSAVKIAKPKDVDYEKQVIVYVKISS